MRVIPAGLQTHLDEPATTTTRLLKISLTSGLTYGLAMLDADVTYDDGNGALRYVATAGFDPTTFSSDIGLSVANAEGKFLISNEVDCIDADMVKAGELDDAQWICYLVNFRDLSLGHAIIDAGDVGEVRMRYGVLVIPELLSYSMRLRQSVGSVWSRTCRAIFGSMPAASQTGCGVDIEPLWASGEVLTVGLETDRLFTGDEVGADSPNRSVPGRLQFLTGNNAGKEYAVEDIEGDEIQLTEPTRYPIEIGDTYRIRPDCRKRYIEDCIGRYSNGPNFKGEPYIPAGDSVSSQIPGAQQGAGGADTGRG